MLCTLLHEMIHAFLGRYGCLGWAEGGCGSDACVSLSYENFGKTGHGRAWQYIARTIEAALPRLLGFKGRLGREEGFLTEMNSLGFRPSECDIANHYGGFTGFVRQNLWTSFDDEDVSRAKIRRRFNRPCWRRKRRWSIR